MEQQWSMLCSNNGAYHRACYGAIMGHAIEPLWGILWSRNRAYYGATMGHTMEQQWGILWSSNGAYYRATMEHTMEQQWSSNRAYYSACHRFIYEGVAGLLQGYILIHNGAVYALSLLYGMPYCCSMVCPITAP